jgi:hypothetical protein
MLELNSPVHLQTSVGKGWAYWAIDYSPHADVIWGVVLDESGRIVWVPNPQVRASANWSMEQKCEGMKKGDTPWQS